jgi:hypothetical protein
MSEHEYTDLLERGIICAVHDHTDLMRDPLVGGGRDYAGVVMVSIFP